MQLSMAHIAASKPPFTNAESEWKISRARLLDVLDSALRIVEEDDFLPKSGKIEGTAPSQQTGNRKRKKVTQGDSWPL